MSNRALHIKRPSCGDAHHLGRLKHYFMRRSFPADFPTVRKMSMRPFKPVHRWDVLIWQHRLSTSTILLAKELTSTCEIHPNWIKRFSMPLSLLRKDVPKSAVIVPKFEHILIYHRRRCISQVSSAYTTVRTQL